MMQKHHWCVVDHHATYRNHHSWNLSAFAFRQSSYCSSAIYNNKNTKISIPNLIEIDTAVKPRKRIRQTNFPIYNISTDKYIFIYETTKVTRICLIANPPHSMQTIEMLYIDAKTITLPFGLAIVRW